MSDPILPLAVWQSGTNENSIPANDNALRLETLSRLVIGVENSPTSSNDGDVFIVGAAPTGDFSTFDEDDLTIYKGGTWYPWAPVDGVHVNVAGTLYAWTTGGGWSAISGGGGGSGDVVGPSSATADRIATFDGTTGKLIKDGGKTIADLRAPAIQSVTSSATVTPTFSDDMVKVTAQAAALQFNNPTGTAIPGLGMVLRVKDNGTARAITWGSQYRAIGVTLPTTTVISKTLYVAMIYNSDDTKWDVLAVGYEP